MKQTSSEFYMAPGSNTEILPVTCHICKDPSNPVKCLIPGEDEMYRDQIEHIAKLGAVHDHCQDGRAAAIKARELDRHNQKKMETWETMCPKDFQKVINPRFKGYNAQKEEQVCRWIYDAMGMLLTGPSGRCKSRFAWAVLKREYDGGRTVEGWTHSDFRLTFTAYASSDMVRAADFCTKLAHLDLLLLDDLGKGRRTPASEEALFTIIDARARANRPTIYTMNTALDVFGAQISEEYREPILRRIHEHTARIEF